MANRTFQQFRLSLDKALVDLYAYAAIGATGAVTFKQWNPQTGVYEAAPTAGSRGVKSIAKGANTGEYVITLQDTYTRLVGVDATFFSATGAAAAPFVGVLSGTGDTDVTDPDGPQLTVLCQSAASTGAWPADGETVLFHLVLQNSSAF